MPASIAPLIAPSPADLADLAALLRDVVEGGASIGFMLPLADATIAGFWSGIFTGATAGERIVLVARDDGHIVGSAQLAFASMPNGRHRCELQKMLVRRSHRGHGIGTALLQAAERAALAAGRTLIVLDTGATGNAIGLYERGGYTRVGVIPRFAADPDGPLIDTIVYYKELAAPSAAVRQSPHA